MSISAATKLALHPHQVYMQPIIVRCAYQPSDDPLVRCPKNETQALGAIVTRLLFVISPDAAANCGPFSLPRLINLDDAIVLIHFRILLSYAFSAICRSSRVRSSESSTASLMASSPK